MHWMNNCHAILSIWLCTPLIHSEDYLLLLQKQESVHNFLAITGSYGNMFHLQWNSPILKFSLPASEGWTISRIEFSHLGRNFHPMGQTGHSVATSSPGLVRSARDTYTLNTLEDCIVISLLPPFQPFTNWAFSPCPPLTALFITWMSSFQSFISFQLNLYQSCSVVFWSSHMVQAL